MGMIHTEITVKNSGDEGDARKGLIGEQEVRSITVDALVDTGASTVVINEELRQKLGLVKTIEKRVKLADGSRVPCWWTEPVDIHWKDRYCSCHAVVINEADTVLLGSIALEGMDLMINPKTRELAGVHGDEMLVLAL